MAKKAGKDPSKMSIAQLGAFLDGADKRLDDMRHALAVEESNVQIFRHELGSRLGLSAGTAATRPTRAAKGSKGKAKAKKGDPSAADVKAIKGKVLDAIPSSGKGKTSGDVRKELKMDSRPVELAFSTLYEEGAIKPADENAKGRFRAMLKVG